MLLCVVFRSCFLCNILYLGTNMCDTPCKYIFNPKILRLLSSNSLLVEGFKLLCLWIEMEDFQAYHWKEKSFIIHTPFTSCVISNVLQLSPFFHILLPEYHKWDQDWMNEDVAEILQFYCIHWSEHCVRIRSSTFSHSLVKFKPKYISNAYIIN